MGYLVLYLVSDTKYNLLKFFQKKPIYHLSDLRSRREMQRKEEQND
jgi:hypothetical protein